MGSKWKIVKPLSLDNEGFDNFIPTVAGCYVVYCDNVLCYVGQSINLYKRIYHNHSFNYARYSNAIETPWGRCRDLTIKYRLPIRYGDWAMIELRLIKRLQPRFNCSGSIKQRQNKKLTFEEAEKLRFSWIFPENQPPQKMRKGVD